MAAYVWSRLLLRTDPYQSTWNGTLKLTDSAWYVACILCGMAIESHDGACFQLFEVAEAIRYLHSSNIIHGNIKGSTILVSNQGTALLTGFSLARSPGVPEDAGMKGVGSIPWQSPELLQGESTSFESDVYAFGITVAEVSVPCYMTSLHC